MKSMKHTTKTDHKPLSLDDLGGGYRLCAFAPINLTF